MRTEYLLQMTPADLDEYARACGIDVSGARGVREKVDVIQGRRERVATIPVLGTTVEVPVKRMHDKAVTDAVANIRSDEDMARAMGMLLGEGQWEDLVARCTDDDGAVDNEALGLACATVITSDELKNF